MRLAAVLMAHRLLRQFFGAGPEAQDRLRAPHDAMPFAGQPPLALLTDGNLGDMDAVCLYLGALAQGHPQRPVPLDRRRRVLGLIRKHTRDGS